MKQTAVEWFAEQLGITGGSLLEKAKNMEKHQHFIESPFSLEEKANYCFSKENVERVLGINQNKEIKQRQ